MTIYEKKQVQKLVDWITDNAEYGDIDELCRKLDVDLEWFDQFNDWEAE